MTLFEYISIAASLILSFSLAQALSNLTPIFARQRRYWVHSAWVVGLLIYHATLFWQLWLYQGVATWTLIEFLLFLLGPIALLISVSLLIPRQIADDYRVFFEQNRTLFYGVLIVMQLQPIPLIFLAFDLPLSFQPIFISNLVFVAAVVVGLVSARPLVDKVLVSFFLVGIIGGLFTLNDHETMLQLLQMAQLDS